MNDKDANRLKKALILDRDGTINIDHGYVYKIKDFELIPGTIDALKALQKEFLLFICTSQSGIGRGYYSLEDFFVLNRHMMDVFEKEDIKIQDIAFCPHAPEDNCSCRKPNKALVMPWIEKYGLDVNNSYVIGDKTSDIKLAENLGMKSVLVMTGEAGKDKKYKVNPTYTYNNLLEAVGVLINGI